VNIFNILSRFFGRYTSFFITEKENDSVEEEKPNELPPLNKKSIDSKRKDLKTSQDEPKYEVIDNSVKTLELPDHNHRLKDLIKELELLNKSLAEEVRIDFKAKSKTAIYQISENLMPENHFQNLIPEYEEINEIKRSKWSEENKKSQNLKNEILAISLFDIHREREEKRKEAERLEKERKLDEEFSKLINSSQKEISNHDFQKAAQKLKEALKIRPEKADTIGQYMKDVTKKESDYKEAKIEEKFLELIENSGKALNNLDFNNARLFLKEALNTRPNKKREIQALIKKADKAQVDYELRKIERKYSDLKEKSKKALKSFDFKNASAELERALKIVPEKKVEIQSLLEEVLERQKEYQVKQEKFDKIFKQAEDSFHNNDLEKAIELFENASLLNINNQLCNRRISDAKSKISRIKKLEKERLEKERIEKIRREKYKEDADAIISFYKSSGIKQFYHYTDSRNVNSILQNNGLFSLNELRRRNIDFLQGSETAEKPDYVRLSYTPEHPLKFVSKKEGRIRTPKTLEIDLEVAKLKKSQFSNVNAARTSRHPTVTFGNDLNYLRNSVKLSVFGSIPYLSLNDEDKAYYQAEIMVKDHLELEYITNLKV